MVAKNAQKGRKNDRNAESRLKTEQDLASGESCRWMMFTELDGEPLENFRGKRARCK